MKSTATLMLVIFTLLGILELDRAYSQELQEAFEASDDGAVQAFYLGCMRGGAGKPVCWELTSRFKSGKLR